MQGVGKTVTCLAELSGMVTIWGAPANRAGHDQPAPRPGRSAEGRESPDSDGDTEAKAWTLGRVSSVAGR